MRSYARVVFEVKSSDPIETAFATLTEINTNRLLCAIVADKTLSIGVRALRWTPTSSFTHGGTVVTPHCELCRRKIGETAIAFVNCEPRENIARHPSNNIC